MGSHYPGTSLRGAIPMLRQKEAHGQSTLGCPAASFCACFCSRQDLTWALNPQIGAVLHLPSLLVCRIHRHTKMRIIMFCACKKIVSTMKKIQKTWLKFTSRLKLWLFFRHDFYFLNSGEIFYSRHFCSNLNSLTLYSTSILRVSKLLISSHTRNCKVLLGIEVTEKHFHN